MMLPILDREWGSRTKTTPGRMNLDWVDRINEALPAHMRRLMEWPTSVANAVLDEKSTGQVATPKISNLRKRKG